MKRLLRPVYHFACYLKADRFPVVRNHSGKVKYMLYQRVTAVGLMNLVMDVLGYAEYCDKHDLMLLIDETDGDGVKHPRWEKYFKQPIAEAHLSEETCHIDRVRQENYYQACKGARRFQYRFRVGDKQYARFAKLAPPKVDFPLARDYAERPQAIVDYARIVDKYIHFQPQVGRYIDDEYTSILKGKERVCAVVIRGGAYVTLAPLGHPKQPPVQDVIDYLKNDFTDWDSIYLATDESDVEDLFRATFPGKILVNNRQYLYKNAQDYVDKKQAKSFEMNHHAELPELEYLSSVILLSKCDYLVGGLCGASQSALLFNGNRYKHLHIFDLGNY